MPSRPDLRDITTGVRDALADCDRETLLDMLTFVVKEYVVDGPPPMLMHQTETVADLGKMSFAQLVVALQTRLDLPELALFSVDGEQVSVRVGGSMHPLVPGRTPPAPVEPARPVPGVRVVETPLVQRPPSAAPPAGAVAAPAAGATTQRSAAPPPSRGMSLRGQPAGQGGGAAAPTPPAEGAAPPAEGAAQPPPAAPERRDESSGGDDASARFSLLELD